MVWIYSKQDARHGETLLAFLRARPKSSHLNLSPRIRRRWRMRSVSAYTLPEDVPHNICMANLPAPASSRRSANSLHPLRLSEFLVKEAVFGSPIAEASDATRLLGRVWYMYSTVIVHSGPLVGFKERAKFLNELYIKNPVLVESLGCIACLCLL